MSFIVKKFKYLCSPKNQRKVWYSTSSLALCFQTRFLWSSVLTWRVLLEDCIEAGWVWNWKIITMLKFYLSFSLYSYLQAAHWGGMKVHRGMRIILNHSIKMINVFKYIWRSHISKILQQIFLVLPDAIEDLVMTQKTLGVTLSHLCGVRSFMFYHHLVGHDPLREHFSQGFH